MNIIWKKPDGAVAVTHVLIEVEDPAAYCAELQARGDLPADWTVAAADYHGSFPDSPIEEWIWDGKAVVQKPLAPAAPAAAPAKS